MFASGVFRARSAARGLLSALLCLALLAGLATERAQAQSQVLVSTIGQTDGTPSTLQLDHAQAFTTGSNSTGYTLNSVEVEFSTTSTTANGLFTVSIHSDTNGTPGVSVGALTNPTLVNSSSASVVTFTSSGGINLAANTTYWIVFDSTSTGLATTALKNTNADTEDAGAASGWSIADTSHSRIATFSGGWTSYFGTKKLRINGVAKATTTFTGNNATFSKGSLRIVDTGSGTYTVVLASQPTHTVTVAIAKGGTHSGAANTNTTSLTFNPSGSSLWSTAQTVTVTGVDESGTYRNRELTLSHNATSTDSDYNNVNLGTVSVEVSDAPVVEAYEAWGFLTRPGRESEPAPYVTTSVKPMSYKYKLRRDFPIFDYGNHGTPMLD